MQWKSTCNLLKGFRQRTGGIFSLHGVLVSLRWACDNKAFILGWNPVHQCSRFHPPAVVSPTCDQDIISLRFRIGLWEFSVFTSSTEEFVEISSSIGVCIHCFCNYR
mmetsp:Transcript_5133/g.10865  ORF Transcript_5133/g.10865 Transcript_5133/m.10865 type:complete len:107 (+) Transcript_5133:1826-2146(+)